MGITESLNIESQFKRAAAFVQEGKTLAAIQIYKKLVLNKESERNATIKLADLYDSAHQTESALKLFYKYLDNNPKDDEIIKLVSYFLVRNSMFSDAAKLITKYSHVKDENMDFLKGIVSFHIGKIVATQNIFSEFIAEYPNSDLLPNVQFYLAKIFFANSRLDDALKMIKNSIAVTDNNSEFHKLEAEIYFKKEMYYHAYESINRALKLNPSVVEWRHFQIKILILLDEIQKAKDKLSNSIDDSNSSAEILHLIGNWYLKNKDIPEANKYFEIAKGIVSQGSK